MKIHMVKKGDTLFLIAQKYNVPLEELIKANPEIANPDAIDVGMKVKIPTGAAPAYEVMHQHTVQQGDTLWKLSKAWGIPLSTMIQANPQLKNPNVLLTGEVVNIPKVPAAGAPVPGIPQWPAGKKNTGVMPAPVTPEPVPAPVPEPAPEMPPVVQPAPPAAVEPIAETPAPVLPAPEVKQPYPTMEFHMEHDLFAQFPIPAVEAAAPCPAPEMHQHYPVMQMPQVSPADMTMPMPQMPTPMPGVPGLEAQAEAQMPVYPTYGHGYGHGYGTMGMGMDMGFDYGHGHPHEHDAGPAMTLPAAAHGYGGWTGAMGHVYDPHDISGIKDGYGDISQPNQVQGAAAVNPSGYLPAFIPGLVQPANKAAGGCKTCGWSPASAWPAPTMTAPQAAFPAYPSSPVAVPVAPVAPATPVTPAAPAAPTATVAPMMVSPAETGPLPQTATPYDAYAAMQDAYGYSPYGAVPYPAYGMQPAVAGAYGASPYPYDMYAQAHAHAYAHAYPAMETYPAMAYPAHAGADWCPPGYEYGIGASGGTPLIPPIPPLPPLREDAAESDGDSALNIHAADESAGAQPRIAKKRPKPKAKSSAGRGRRPVRKESLPWIKW